jgi:hypothetical protein
MKPYIFIIVLLLAVCGFGFVFYKKQQDANTSDDNYNNGDSNNMIKQDADTSDDNYKKQDAVTSDDDYNDGDSINMNKHNNQTIDTVALQNALYKKWYNQIDNIIMSNGLPIDPFTPLAIMQKESGFQSVQGVPCASVIGDDGRSIGYMQMSQPAVTSVNEKYGKNYSVSDMQNQDMNILAACYYISICYNASTSMNSLFLKYNGGVGNYRGHKPTADSYADIAESYYNYYRSIVNE